MTHLSTVRNSLRVSAMLLVVLASFFLPAQAQADPTRERARKHVVDGDSLKDKAETAKSSGDSERAAQLFQESADEYQAAYELVPHPLMLYNLAQVYRLAGDAEKSLQFYQEFLASSPTGEAADFARKYVKILERSIEQANARKDPLVGTGDDDDDDDTGDDDDDDDDDDTVIKDVKKGPDTKTGGEGSDSMRYGGLGLAAAGLLSIGVGVKFGLDAQNISNCLTNYPNSCDTAFPPGQWSDEALLLQDEGESAEFKMFVFTGLGAAAIVGGGVLYYFGQKSEHGHARDSRTLSLSPSVDAQSAGWTLSGRF